MSFISLIAALLLEQWKSLSPVNRAYGWLWHYVDYVTGKFNGGRSRDGLNTWLLIMLPIMAGAELISSLLSKAGGLFLLAWYIGTLYLAFGFRHYGNFFSGIMAALQNSDLLQARQLLTAWCNQRADELDADDIAREATDLALLSAHRYVFGVIAWFVVLGPAGALGYRIAALLAEQKHSTARVDATAAAKTLDAWAVYAFYYIDYVPARLTALVFAVVGDFMGAMKRWRQAAYRYQRTQDVVLNIGAGALGVMSLGEGGFDYMHAAGALLWRALVLWLFAVLLVTAAIHL